MDLMKVRRELNLGVPLSNMNLRVTYYSRVSTDSLKQHSSLINQSDYFDELIKNNSNWEYVEGYVDDGISGTNVIKRNNFLKMIRDAKKNKFDLIVTKEISRFSRNTLDSIMYTRELLSYGVAVLFINDNINTALPDSELRLTIMASMAQDEIRRLSERVKFGMKRSIKNGKILGNDMLFGYRKDKSTGRLNIVEKEAKIVRRIFNMYIFDNLSLTKISKILNEENIKTIQKKKWCSTTIIRMLKNIKYKGYYCGGKSEIIDYMTKKIHKKPIKEWTIYKDYKKIPPIVTEKIWNAVNKKIEKTKCYKHLNSSYIFSSKLYCKKCGSVFHRRKQCKASDDITWLCSKYLKEGKEKCNSANIRESELINIFNDLFLKLDINIKDIIDGLYMNYENKYRKIIERIIKKLNITEVILKIILKRINVFGTINDIDLNIYVNYKIINTIQCKYSFNRGYNTTGTKRYKVNYSVFLLQGE